MILVLNKQGISIFGFYCLIFSISSLIENLVLLPNNFFGVFLALLKLLLLLNYNWDSFFFLIDFKINDGIFFFGSSSILKSNLIGYIPVTNIDCFLYSNFGGCNIF